MFCCRRSCGTLEIAQKQLDAQKGLKRSATPTDPADTETQLMDKLPDETLDFFISEPVSQAHDFTGYIRVLAPGMAVQHCE